MTSRDTLKLGRSFEPLVPRPHTAEAVDALARRARAYVEVVIRGIQLWENTSK